MPPPRPHAWVTWCIVFSTIAVFLLQLLAQRRYGDDVLGDALAFSRDAWFGHRYWTLLTYAWAHSTDMFGNPDYFWLHIAANLVPLVCLGPPLEEMIGHVRFLVLYTGGAIASVLVWFHFNPLTAEPIIGASGAVFAVIAGLGAAAPREIVTILVLYVIPVRTSLRLMAIVICGAEVVQMYFHWMPEVAHTAHLGGAAFGALFVLLARPWRKRAAPAITRARDWTT
jgi:membrane associated rhomboid family serine protease